VHLWTAISDDVRQSEKIPNSQCKGSSCRIEWNSYPSSGSGFITPDFIPERVFLPKKVTYSVTLLAVEFERKTGAFPDEAQISILASALSSDDAAMRPRAEKIREQMTQYKREIPLAASEIRACVIAYNEKSSGAVVTSLKNSNFQMERSLS
jgi:hypothetical protein